MPPQLGLQASARHASLARWATSFLTLLALFFGWAGLFPLLSRNVATTTGVIAALGLCAASAFFVRLGPQTMWLLLLSAAGDLMLPLWAALLIALIALRVARRWQSAFLVLAIAIVAGSINQALQTYGFGTDVLLAIRQSNLWEIADFVLATVGRRLPLGVVAFALVLFAYLTRGQQPPPARALPAVILVFTFLVDASIATLPPLKEARAALKAGPRLAEAPPAPMHQRDIDVVLLLGESMSRWHMQLYGYPYPTDSRLMQRKADLVLLTDAISVHSHTVPSVESLMLRPKVGDSDAVVSLLGMLRSAGVRTHWYTTQIDVGPWDSPLRGVLGDAEEQHSFTSRGTSLPLGLDYALGIGPGFTADDDMIQRLVDDLRKGSSASGDTSTLRVAHLTAAHWDYCRHLPHAARAAFETQSRGARYFGDAPDLTRDVNCYDAAVRFVDGLIDEVMDAAQRRARPTLVVFAPDHGEDPDGGTGHASSLHSSRHIEIPIVFYANEAARQRLGPQYARLAANAGKPFALPWLNETLLDVFGAGQDGTDLRRSLLSAAYAPEPREVFDGALQYDLGTRGDAKDYLRRAALEVRAVAGSSVRPAHVLAHRNDSELALLEGMQSFEGAEMDVVFNEQTRRFDIYHEPAAPTGFSLERALQIGAAKPGMLFWLDWKNPTASNIAAAVAELERLDATFQIKERVWVETAPSLVALERPLLSEHGFRHAHYLAPSADLADACMRDRHSQACTNGARASAAVARRIGARYVSFDRAVEAFARAVLEADPGLKPLTWDLSRDASAPGLARRLAAQADAEVVLVWIPSRFRR